MNNPDICFYHDNCTDGFASAYAVRQRFGNDVKYMPAVYSNEIPEGIENKHVYFVDFSYKRAQMLEIASRAKSVTIIDHHEAAIMALHDMPDNVDIVFDKSECGASLTWKTLNPDTPMPKVFEYIKDYDLWNISKNEDIIPVALAIRSDVFDFHLWDWFCTDDGLEDLLKNGKPLAKMLWGNVRDVIKSSRYVNIEGFECIPYINCPGFLTNYVGEKLGTEHPFIITYSDTRSLRKYSLRSNKNTGVTINELAAKFGGGGHPNASAFVVQYDDLSEFESALEFCKPESKSKNKMKLS